MTPGPDGEDDGHGGQNRGATHELGFGVVPAVNEGVLAVNVGVLAVVVVAPGQITDALTSRTSAPITELKTSRILVTVVRPLSEAQRTVSGNPRWSKS